MRSLRETRACSAPVRCTAGNARLTASAVLSPPPLPPDLPLRSKEVRPAVTLRHAIEEWLDEHGLTFEQVGRLERGARGAVQWPQAWC